MSEQEFIARGFGKWSQRGVPHKGWTCTEVYDLDDDRVTCEMCESAEVRYVHVMKHPQWQGYLEVGCICAGNMEQDLIGAELREKEFKRRQNPRVAIALAWMDAADEILARPINLRPNEAQFVRDMRSRARYSARPRVRKDFTPTARQASWFAKIYRSVVWKDFALAQEAEAQRLSLLEQSKERITAILAELKQLEG
jgi:hypothetical protein